MYESANTSRTRRHQRLVFALSHITGVGVLCTPTNRTAVAPGVLRDSVSPCKTVASVNSVPSQAACNPRDRVVALAKSRLQRGQVVDVERHERAWLQAGELTPRQIEMLRRKRGRV